MCRLHRAGGKKAGADPGTEMRQPPNFSKVRAAAIAIIPNEKVTAAILGMAHAPSGAHAIDAVSFYILRRGLETPLVHAVSQHTRLVSIICETYNLRVVLILESVSLSRFSL